MSAGSRRRPSAAIVVATVALVLAMAGSAVAGALIDGSSIKKHSIPGNRLVDHTLTAQQIDLKHLGTVPQAANAGKLGGKPPGAYLLASKLFRWSFKMNKGSAPHVFAYGPLTFTATCNPDTTNTDGLLTVKTSEPGTYVSRNPDAEPGGGMVLPDKTTHYNVVEQDSSVKPDGNDSEFEAFDPKGKVAIFSTAFTVGVAINTPGADCRFFGYLVNDA